MTETRHHLAATRCCKRSEISVCEDQERDSVRRAWRRMRVKGIYQAMSLVRMVRPAIQGRSP